MRGRSQELDAKLQRFNARAESGSPASIVRSKRSAAQETFRSGWSRPPQVAPAARRSTSLPSSRGLQLPQEESLADRLQSPGGSSSSGAGRWRFARDLPGQELRHEGWLAKLSSGKICRWQQRYFRLEGCYLRYMQTPGSSSKKTFNLRKAQSLRVAEDSRELILDFGYRSWHLRATDAGEARRWLVLLEAGRLTAGEPEEAADSDSDGSTVCSVPSTSSSTVAESQASTPKFGGQKEETFCRAPVIAETLELSPTELDRDFEGWLATVASATTVCDGLSRALHGLWLRLCDVCAVAVKDESLRLEAARRRPAAAAERAAARLLQGAEKDAPALEHFVGEYLTRMQQSLASWLKRCDPPADEVATVAKWFLFQAEPALLPFCEHAETFAGRRLTTCEEAVLAIEKLLLREWETRSCEEASALCSFTFEGHYAEEVGRVQLGPLLRGLQDAAVAWRAWQGHADACSRATSVLIAMLNASLRCLQVASRGLAAEAKSRRRRSTLPKMMDLGRSALLEIQKVSSCSDGRSKASQELAATVVEDAVQLANFCRNVTVEGLDSSQKLCQEVLGAFASAFDVQALSLARSWVLHSAQRHLRLPEVDAWEKPLRRYPEAVQAPLRSALAEHLALRWLRRADAAALPGAAAAAALRRVAPSAEAERFAELVEQMQGFLRAGRWDGLAAVEKTLAEVLEEHEARALTQTLWRMASRTRQSNQ